MSREKIYKVAEITRLVKKALESGFGSVWIEGELSNFHLHGSGHCYFTIKDEKAQLRAVMFRGSRTRLEFEPADGMLVRVQGKLTVYEPRGEYQIVVERMEQSGKGALREQFEKLKKKLLDEGLFAAERKQQIPLLPQHVGVVTSPTGAAIRDILQVVGRRFPNMHIVLAPVRVQGAGSAEEIAAAIDLLNEYGELDVMIVGRGGGSLEDLWSFNEEVVARAVARSRIPVISAVGHEIDFTICDFTADLRAATPSAAAELVVGRKEEFEERLSALEADMRESLKYAAEAAGARVRTIAGSYVFREPSNLVARYRQSLEGIELRARHALTGRSMELSQRVDELSSRMETAVVNTASERRQDVRRLAVHLNAISPLAVLQRGYSMTSDSKGRFIRSAKDVKEGQEVATRVADGEFRSKVTEKGRKLI